MIAMLTLPILCQEGLFELRASLEDRATAQKNLESVCACFKGEYAFIDYIYRPWDREIDLNEEFIRLRVYQKTNWAQRNCVLIHKPKKVYGQSSVTFFNKEFDSLAEAQNEIAQRYQLLFSFSRNGYEYALDGMRIFVEDIQGLPASIEVIAASKEQIMDLFNILGVNALIADSVPAWIENDLKYEQKN